MSIPGDDAHDRITVRGRLKVRSYERAPVALEVEKELMGTVKEVPAGARLELLADPPRYWNPHTRLSWELTLEPGATAELAYEYVFLAP